MLDCPIKCELNVPKQKLLEMQNQLLPLEGIQKFWICLWKISSHKYTRKGEKTKVTRPFKELQKD